MVMPVVWPWYFIRGALAVIFWIILGLGFLGCGKKAPSRKYIAYIGRFTHRETQEKNKYDLLQEYILKKHLHEINEAHGTNLELMSFDNKWSGSRSDSIYSKIAKDSNIVMVIDNTWGEHIKHCAKTIKESGIPVISINADHNSLDFGSNTIFTGNGDHYPFDLIAFLKNVLHEDEINFVSETDYPLHETYLKEFERQGIRVRGLVPLSFRSAKVKDTLAIIRHLKDTYRDSASAHRITLFNIHSYNGEIVLQYLNRHYSHLRLLGHNFTFAFDRHDKVPLKSSNQLIMSTSSTDALSKAVVKDIQYVRENSAELLTPVDHSFFVKRCHDVASILEGYFVHQKSNGMSKAMFLDYFHGLKNAQLVTESGVYDFDESMTMLPELYFTNYSNGRFDSYPMQLNQKRKAIPNLSFGMEIQDIYNIDINSNSFTADFYYWVKLDTNNKESEKFILFQNMKQNESSKEQIIEKVFGSTMYKLYKVSGVFYVNFDLQNYPFDEQEIFIQAQILSPSDQIKVSFDDKSFILNPKIIEKMKINEWEKKKYYVTVENSVSKGLYGDPDINSDSHSMFKNIYYRLVVKRNHATAFLEIVIPLFLIGIVAISLLMVKDVSFENLGEVSIGVFITIVTFSISYSTSTPNSDTLTRADLLFWTTFAIVLVVFLIVIVTNSLYSKEEVANIDLRRFGLAMGIVFTTLCSFYIFY